jgi:RNA polymerase sigma-70 factor (ECF subfamily)
MDAKPGIWETICAALGRFRLGEGAGLFAADAVPALAWAGAGQPGQGNAADGRERLILARSARPSREESEKNAQPSTRGGVDEDMATLVLDNPALGSGGGAQGAHLPPADPADDAAVMLRAAAGDDSAFTYLVEKYHRPIVHFLYRMVHTQAVAEELAQEVFLRVYRSRESYRAEARFTTWLYRIATNLAVNHARDTRHERAAQTIYLDEPDPETGSRPDVTDEVPRADEQMLREERMAQIRARVMELPERQRMAVLMHKYQGMDYRQIGEVLKLSESATKSLLFRAYQTLRESLKEFV